MDINLLFHSTNYVSYIGTFSQQNRKSRVGTLDKPFWACNKESPGGGLPYETDGDARHLA